MSGHSEPAPAHPILLAELVRPPGRAQELHLELRSSIEALTQRLGRSPTVPELAAELRVDECRILEALEAGAAHQTASLAETVGFADG